MNWHYSIVKLLENFHLKREFESTGETDLNKQLTDHLNM